MKRIFLVALAVIMLFVFCSCYIPLNGFHKNDIGTRYYKNDVYQTGWIEIEGEKYYFSKETGYMLTKSQNIAGVWYGFSPDGKLANGFLLDDDGTRYYIDGVYQTGWQDIDNSRYYFKIESGLMVTGTVKIQGVDYSFSSDGKLLDNNNQN